MKREFTRIFEFYVFQSKQESEGRKLSHGEQLKIGSTTFLLHIHPGNETCDECEPGQVQAQLKAKEMEDESELVYRRQKYTIITYQDAGCSNSDLPIWS